MFTIFAAASVSLAEELSPIMTNLPNSLPVVSIFVGASAEGSLELQIVPKAPVTSRDRNGLQVDL